MWIALVILGLFLLTGLGLYIYDKFQKKHSLRRNFPIFGRLRWLAEWLRPKIQQYFIESDTDGAPISKVYRNLVYQRSKGDPETVPFGTKNDLYKPQTEWVAHSDFPLGFDEVDKWSKRVIFGSGNKAYSASIINTSAMSFGALSAPAVEALSLGAKNGGFAVNTGEGGISPYHLKHENDIIWQIGTGYFGCRNEDGTFSPDKFALQCQNPNIKMIELKLSQGAKPGHGGILPGAKNTPEIAEIRGVLPGVTIHSPTSHSAFDSYEGMMQFVQSLKRLSIGKPVGIKLCISNEMNFQKLVDAMIKTGISPDFITVDGAEGGTGSAPMEFTNNVGMPLLDGLHIVKKTLNAAKLTDIKICASGKVLSGFDVLKLLCLGADTVNIARGMMLSLGCIHALECHNGKCPTGITTHDKKLTRGLDIEDKSKRVESYHRRTLTALIELMAACRMMDEHDFSADKIYRRLEDGSVKTYDEIFETSKI